MNPNVSRLGAINGAAENREEARALFLKTYAGEVLTAFQRTNVTMDKHQMRTITHGKSAQFPVTGRAAAFYHKVGDRIDGGKIPHAERTIHIDDMLISPTFIHSMDEAMNHYDVRSIYSGEQGVALSNQMDQHVLQMGVKAARETVGNITGPQGTPSGTVVYQNTNGIPEGADFRNNGDHLAAAVYKAVEELATKDVPTEDLFLYVRPEQYYKLVQSDKVINRDFNPEGNGSYRSGKVFEVAGVEIVMTNNLPATQIDMTPQKGDVAARYAGDFSNCVGLLMHRSAVGTLKLLDLGLESEYQIEYQGTLMVAKYAVGHGVLRPEAAAEIRAESAATGE